MPIPNSRSRPPRILAHELRWGRGGGRQPPSVDWWFLNLTAASVPDVGCVPSPRSLDASVAGFSTLALPPPCTMQGGAGLTVQPLSSTSAVCRRRVLARREASLASIAWCYHRHALCRGASLTVCSLCPRRRLCAVAVLARHERRWLSLRWCTTAVRAAAVRV